MIGWKIIPTLLLAAQSVTGLAIDTPTTNKEEARASCVAYCGNVCYWSSDISEAVAQGYNYHRNGQTVGSNSYPHSLDNREGFSWYKNPPYYEFPILSSYKVYTGGSPGPDRVIFDNSGRLARLLTHTGASGNGFVECRQ